MVLAKRASEYARNGKFQYLLRGMIFCECGMRMISGYNRQTNRKGSRYGYRRYKCASKFRHDVKNCGFKEMNAERAEAEVWQQVTKLLADPQRIKKWLAQRERQKSIHDQFQLDLQAAEKKLATIETTRGRLVKMIARADNDEDAALFEAELAAQTKQLRETRATIDDLQERMRSVTSRRVNVDKFLSVCEQLGGVLESWCWEKKRRALEVLEVRVHREEGKVVVEIPLSIAQEEIPLSRNNLVIVKGASISM
jgi:chromosome segregation ATPase